MLGGLFLLMASVGIVAVIVWSILNDRNRPMDKTTGLFAMRDEPVNPPPEPADGSEPRVSGPPHRGSKRPRRGGRSQTTEARPGARKRSA